MNTVLPSVVSAEENCIGYLAHPYCTEEYFKWLIDAVPVDAFVDDDCRAIREVIEAFPVNQCGRMGVEDLRVLLEENKKNVSILRLSNILDNGHSETSARRSANRVIECYHRRKAILSIQEVAKEGCNVNAVQATEWRESTLQLCNEVLQYTSDENEPVNAASVMIDVLERQRRIHESGLPPGCDTGYLGLTKCLGGFKKGHLYILAARPSMGKTAFALCSARRSAIKGSKHLFVSLEMPIEDLVARLIAQTTGYATNALGANYGDVYDRLVECFDSNSFHISDIAASTVEMIGAIARSHQMRHGLDVLWIDYLGLISVSQKFQSREREVSHISKSLKSLAKSLDCAVVALSQLNRDLERRPNKRPMLADLRDSGTLEQDADSVLFIYRDIVYDPDSDPFDAELLVSKNRTGETGVFHLLWDGVTTRFDDIQ